MMRMRRAAAEAGRAPRQRRVIKIVCPLNGIRKSYPPRTRAVIVLKFAVSGAMRLQACVGRTALRN